MVLDKRIPHVARQLTTVSATQEPCQRLMQIEGVGPLTATAILATVTNPTTFKNGRQLAAWLGLVPRQCSSGHTRK